MGIELDASRPVRPGEELPVDSLSAYLCDQLAAARGELRVEQFPHGHSNLTYLLRWDGFEAVLRRPPFGNRVQSAHDMSREFRVLSKLCEVFPLAPRPFLFCADESIIGAPFYVLERRNGFVIRKSRGCPNPAELRRSSEALVDTLAALHRLDAASDGLADLGKPAGYVSRQVDGWSERYEKAKTDEVPEMERVGAWLRAHRPAESGAAVVHNDFKFDNLMLDPTDFGRVVAVLDWEMATLGDPMMDLGTSLAYWIEATDSPELQQAAMGPTTAPGCPTRRDVVDRYFAACGRAPTDPLYYYAFGLFKVATIVQQIYARYRRGTTADARFAKMDALVVAMGRQADRALERATV